MATIEDFIKEWQSEREYVVAHTSGSTGVPKEIHLLKSDMRVSAIATNKRFGIDRGSTIAAPLSIDYIAGKMMCVRAIEAGCQLHRMPVSNTVIIDREFDLLAVVPSQVESIIEQPDAAKLIKNLIVGGAPLSDRLAQCLVERGFNAFATYGMTETCSHVALSRIGDAEAIFEAMPGVTFDKDERGCLIINAPEYSFGRLVTNDLANLIDEHSFIWKGRFDNIINSGGIKISPETLEKQIGKYISTPFYVIGVSDEHWGEIPIIVYEGNDSDRSNVIDILRQHIDHRLCPKRAIAVKQLPRTSNGKILRKKP